MRTLVIGTSGQLATELRRIQRPAAIQLLPAVRVDLADQAQVDALLDGTRPEIVVNAGAYTAVDKAESEPARAFAVNAGGPSTLAAWCERQGAALVHVSTDYVFDGSQRTPYQVDDLPNPLNAYGASKLAGELAIRANLRRHVILRTSWVFSAHGQNFVKTMLRLARERDELRVVADQVGRPTAAADLAHAIWLLTARIATTSELGWGTYHYACAGSTTWHGLAEAIVAEQRERTGRAPRVVPITSSEFPTQAKRPAWSVLDTSRFESAFGTFAPAWSVGLRDVVNELSTPTT